jgi:hypothetical protein
MVEVSASTIKAARSRIPSVFRDTPQYLSDWSDCAHPHRRNVLTG